MTNVSSTIWYGAVHDFGTEKKSRLKRVLSWVSILLGFALIRLLLPFQETDSALIHSRIVEALGASQIWGRQALVSSFEFPTFITICVMFAEQFARIIPIEAGKLLVITAQTWTFFYILRIPQTLKERSVTVVILLILGLSPEFQAAFLTDDPNWIATVPVASALYHLVRWQRYNSLRDAVVLGIACGLLVFCGPVGLVIALVFLLVSTLNIRRLPRLYDTQNMKGVGLLIWAPFGYCLGLLFLANWLIMHHALYPLRSFAPALTPGAFRTLPETFPHSVMRLPWFCLGGLVIAFCSVIGKRKVAAEGLAAGLIALFALGGLFGETPVYMPGLAAHRLVLGITAVLFPGLFLSEQFEIDWKRYAALSLTGLAIFAGIAFPRQQNLPETKLLGNPPLPEEITALTDVYWQNGRIAVFGLRAPAFFFDRDEKRFIKRVDFFPDELLSAAQNEQLYLLVPPNDGRFYAPASHLARIHDEGADWLLLEKAWPSGWQLWRSIVYDPPQSVKM